MKKMYIVKVVDSELRTGSYYRHNGWGSSDLHAHEFKTRNDALTFIEKQCAGVYKIETIYIVKK